VNNKVIVVVKESKPDKFLMILQDTTTELEKVGPMFSGYIIHFSPSHL